MGISIEQKYADVIFSLFHTSDMMVYSIIDKSLVVDYSDFACLYPLLQIIYFIASSSVYLNFVVIYIYVMSSFFCLVSFLLKWYFYFYDIWW